MSGSWQAERAAAHRLPHKDPRAEVGEDVRVGVAVVVCCPMEFKLIWTSVMHSRAVLCILGTIIFHVCMYA